MYGVRGPAFEKGQQGQLYRRMDFSLFYSIWFGIEAADQNGEREKTSRLKGSYSEQFHCTAFSDDMNFQRVAAPIGVKVL